MSLNWDLSKIADWQTVCQRTATAKDHDASQGIEVGDTLLHPVTRALIWGALATEIGTITADNAGEVFDRIWLWERAAGNFLRNGDGSPRPITFADVKAHIGLRTNVFPKITAAAFAKKLARIAADERARQEREAPAAPDFVV